MRAFLLQYGDGLKDVETLVDVGGGTGRHVAEIVQNYPHIKGINFDLPHVVATAPPYDGVSHMRIVLQF
ncbi:Desmethylxanthohumol 6'-O-methyltransferase, partial [Turnera subulata]